MSYTLENVKENLQKRWNFAFYIFETKHLKVDTYIYIFCILLVAVWWLANFNFRNTINFLFLKIKLVRRVRDTLLTIPIHCLSTLIFQVNINFHIGFKITSSNTVQEGTGTVPLLPVKKSDSLKE